MGTIPSDSAPGRPPTIIDIAADAGVSKTTVSRVMNGSAGVAPETRSRVLEAADRLGFRLNLAARTLRTRRSAMVGLMVPMVREPFALIAEGLDLALAQQGVGLMISCSRWDAGQDIPKLESLRARGVEAFVVSLSDDRDPAVAAYLRSLHEPVVLLDREIRGLRADSV